MVYPQLFTDVDETIESCFKNNHSLIYLDGSKAVVDNNLIEYMLSKYDVYPNEKAHEKMVEHAFKTIINLN